MTRHPLPRSAGLAPAIAALSVSGLIGCSGPSEAPGAANHPASLTAEVHAHRSVTIPTPGQTIRVGGDMDALITRTDGEYRFGPCRIDTPLPAGYPPPTPIGAIDLKSYPPVRLAEVAGSGNPDRGMNQAFWPLFNHIKKHDIAMTSPVEMTYSQLGADDASRPSAWSMAFLYRTPDMNTPGVEGAVTVRDARPTTVLAVGVKGDYSMALVERGRRTLEQWLADNPQWVPAGDWRSLYYNGPALFFWNKWAEVQVPVRPASTGQAAADAPTQPR